MWTSLYLTPTYGLWLDNIGAASSAIIALYESWMDTLHFNDINKNNHRSLLVRCTWAFVYYWRAANGLLISPFSLAWQGLTVWCVPSSPLHHIDNRDILLSPVISAALPSLQVTLKTPSQPNSMLELSRCKVCALCWFFVRKSSQCRPKWKCFASSWQHWMALLLV